MCFSGPRKRKLLPFIFCIVGALNYTRFFSLIIYEKSRKDQRTVIKTKILCPVECKSGSHCNDDQDCPKGQCLTTFYFDDARECVCDKDCKQGSICYPDLQDAALCDGNGRCKQIATSPYPKYICECGKGNNNKNSSMDHPFRHGFLKGG